MMDELSTRAKKLEREHETRMAEMDKVFEARKRTCEYDDDQDEDDDFDPLEDDDCDDDYDDEDPELENDDDDE